MPRSDGPTIGQPKGSDPGVIAHHSILAGTFIPREPVLDQAVGAEALVRVRYEVRHKADGGVGLQLHSLSW